MNYIGTEIGDLRDQVDGFSQKALGRNKELENITEFEANKNKNKLRKIQVSPSVQQEALKKRKK